MLSKSSTCLTSNNPFNPRIQTRSHAENVAESAARAAAPVSLPNFIGGGAGLVDQEEKDLDRAIEILKGYLTEDRMARMQGVLDQRTGSAAIVFENPANPNNVGVSSLT